MFSLRLSRPFQNLCAGYNARAFRSFTSRPAITKRSLVLEHTWERPSPLQLQGRFASSSTYRNASFAFSGFAARQNLFGSKGLGLGAALAGAGLGFAALQLQRPVLCDAPPTSPASAPRAELTPTPMQPDDALPPPSRSSLNMFELSFGVVAGICAGVFIKKGAKALAFAFGGVFVLLQYLTSIGLIRVNWSRLETGYEDKFHSCTTDATGKEVSHPPTVYSLFRWLVDFLTASFPQRATFLAGMMLGLRLG